MKNNVLIITKSIVLFIFILSNFTVKSQSLSREKSLFYLIKMQGFSIDNFIDIYGLSCDKINYKNSISNEFKRNSYRTKVKGILKTGVDNIKFSDKFTLDGVAELGEYIFDIEAFPIKKIDLSQAGYFSDETPAGVSIYVYKHSLGNFINWNDIGFIVKMKSAIAEKFIQSRNMVKGSIDRKVFVRATYSILEKGRENKDGYIYWAYIYSIDIFSDKALTTKIYTITPNIDYFDKVKGIKFKDGEIVEYFDSRWNKIGYENGAAYKRIINYLNGKVNGTVKTYYISSGQLQMEGTYGDYYVEDGCGNGLFTWYYPNGNKSEQVNYSNGKKDGLYESWYENGINKEKSNYKADQKDGLFRSYHENGEMSERLNYLNGIPDGCHYKWREDGRCTLSTIFDKYPYYINGSDVETPRGEPKCPCKNSSQFGN